MFQFREPHTEDYRQVTLIHGKIKLNHGNLDETILLFLEHRFREPRATSTINTLPQSWVGPGRKTRARVWQWMPGRHNKWSHS